jgi:putative membrane protein
MTDETRHTGLHRAADKMTDAAGAMAGRAEANAAGSHDSAAFVANAARGDLLEIASAKQVLSRSGNAEIIAAAKRMLHDHETLSHQLRSALRSDETPTDISVPEELDERRKTVLEHLTAAPDDKFDKTYADQQVLAHRETADLMTGYADNGDNPQLRSVARSAAPLVKRHLARMEALRSQL